MTHVLKLASHSIRRYEADCHGKEAFESPDLARKAAERIRRRKVAADVYRCQHCGRWHVGSHRKNDRLARRRKG